MKIAILTMAYRQNYGGILQCIALQNTLKNMGHEVEVIHFVSTEKNGIQRKLKYLFGNPSFKEVSLWLYDKMIDSIEQFLGKQKNVSKVLIEKCSKFISENIAYTETCDEVTIGLLAAQRNYDALVIGSDKIWGGLGRERLIYFADWSPTFKGKIISYAACSSRADIPPFNKAKIEFLLSRFTALSVRDKHTYNLINTCTEKDVAVVADPTLLYNFDHFLDVKQVEQPYVFVYILGREIKGGHRLALKYIREKYGSLPIKAVVLSDESTDVVPYVDEVITDASPRDWLNLLVHSTFVYTDSFHGLIFSLKYNKQFLGYYREKNRSSRLIGLRDFFGLEKRIVNSLNEAIYSKSLDEDVNYKEIQRKIDSFREYSLNFLETALIR